MSKIEKDIFQCELKEKPLSCSKISTIEPYDVDDSCTETASVCSDFRQAAIGCIENKNIRSQGERSGFSKDFFRLQEQLKLFSMQKDVRFVDTSKTENLKIKNFRKVAWNKKMRRKIDRVKGVLETEYAKIDQFLAQIEQLFNNNKNDFKNFDLIQKFWPSLAYANLVSANIEDIFHLFQKFDISESCENELVALKRACEVLKGVLRYAIEAEEGTYRSGRFSAEYVADVLGFNNTEELFVKPNGQRRKIVDLGCGDGDLLRELVKKWRRVERADFIAQKIFLLFKTFGQDISDESRKIIHKRFITRVDQSGINLRYELERTDPHLIGVEQATTFLETLCGPEIGISTKKGDICASFDNFQQQTKISANSVDVVTTVLTLDRAYDLTGLLNNIRQLLKKDGKFMIVTKGIIDAKSDGEGMKGRPVQYADNDNLRSNTRIKTVEKLLDVLSKQGLQVHSVSCHPYEVISTDCKTGPQNSGPQKYNLVVLAGTKIS